jgi:hypothetical protein
MNRNVAVKIGQELERMNGSIRRIMEYIEMIEDLNEKKDLRYAVGMLVGEIDNRLARVIDRKFPGVIDRF